MRALVPSSVAAIVILSLLGTFFLNNTSSFALAQVIKAAETHKLVKYKITQTTEDKRNGTGLGTSMSYADLAAPRFREERRGLTLNETVEMVFLYIQDGSKDRALSVLNETVVPDAEKGDSKDPLSKAAIAKKFKAKHGDGRKEASLSRISQGSDPIKKAHSLIESLRELEAHKDVVITKDEVGSRETVKYYLEDNKKTIRLWVDAKTNLPVQFEYEVLDPTPAIALNKWVYSDFEWDPQVKGFPTLDALFDTTPPDGYSLTDRTKENDAK